jgi:hypothetical protein
LLRLLIPALLRLIIPALLRRLSVPLLVSALRGSVAALSARTTVRSALALEDDACSTPEAPQAIQRADRSGSLVHDGKSSLGGSEREDIRLVTVELSDQLLLLLPSSLSIVQRFHRGKDHGTAPRAAARGKMDGMKPNSHLLLTFSDLIDALFGSRFKEVLWCKKGLRPMSGELWEM